MNLKKQMIGLIDWLYQIRNVSRMKILEMYRFLTGLYLLDLFNAKVVNAKVGQLMEWYNPRFVFEDLSMEVVKEMSNEEVKKKRDFFSTNERTKPA